MTTQTGRRRMATAEERQRYRSFEALPHTMPELLVRQAQREHSGPAVIAADGSMSFAVWAERAAAGGTVLRRAGVRTGMRVGLWGHNRQGADWIAALLAIQWAGGVPVPLNSRMPLAAATPRLQRLGAQLVVAGTDSAAPGDGIEVLPLDLWRHCDQPHEAPDLDPARACSIFHTSGTTGPPKAALISHEALAYSAAMTEEYILAPPCGVPPLGPRDVIQTSVPLFTSSALLHYIALSLWTGCRLVCEPEFDAASTVQAMNEHSSTIWLTVPSMMVLVADAHPQPPEQLALRAVWHMGSVATTECIQDTLRVFPQAAVLNLYSLTETAAGMVVSHARDAHTKPGSSGRPTATTRLRVVRDDGTPADIGEVGEVQFESPYMFDGYDGDPAASQRFFTEDGWGRSGDGGRLDADGVLWVTGRLGDVIIRGGLKVNPVAVERVIAAHPGVADVVVVPIPHRVLGHDIAGLIVGDGVDVTALRSHCLEHLAANEVPRSMLMVDEIPRNEFGKLNRRAAAELAAGLLQPDAAGRR